MALTTRTLPDELSPPRTIEQNGVLTYLSFHRLRAAILVSKAWNVISSDATLWKKALEKDEKAQSRLPRALVAAIKAQKVDQLHRWISVGARVDIRYQGTVDREFTFGTPAAGHFENPTVLSVAANLASGQEESAKIICLLLSHGADVLQESHYSDWVASIGAYGGEFPPNEISGSELPSKSACDDSIKALLQLAEFETELLKPNVSTVIILGKLKDASDNHRTFVREYLDQLMLLPDDVQEEKKEFVGVQKKLKPIHRNKLIEIAEFNELYRTISQPNFFEEHWLSLLAAGLGVFYSLCCFKSTMCLGAFFIGLFSSATIPAALAIILGVLIVGLISGGTCELFKKIWDYYHPEIHFPIVLDNKPQPKSFYGKLFPNYFTISRENKEDKAYDASNVSRPLSPTIF